MRLLKNVEVTVNDEDYDIKVFLIEERRLKVKIFRGKKDVTRYVYGVDLNTAHDFKETFDESVKKQLIKLAKNDIFEGRLLK